MSILHRALIIMAVIAISTAAFRPVLVEGPTNDRFLSSSDVLLLETNEARSFSIDLTSLARYYWDVPTVPVPMRIEVTPTNNYPYTICYNPEVGDYDQDSVGVCQNVDGGFGSVKLTASLLRKWHGKNLRIYVQLQYDTFSIGSFPGSIILKRDNMKAIGIGVGVGVGGAALLSAVGCAIAKFAKSKSPKDNAKKNKKDKKDNKDDKDDKEDKDDDEKKEKKEKKNRKNSQDSDQEPETSEPNKKCKDCHCHKGSHSSEHLTQKELEYYFPSRRFDTFNSSFPQNSCTVCSADFKHDVPCRQLYCGHIFHTSCIDGEVRRNNKCPTCYGAMTREAIQSLIVYRSNEQRKGADNANQAKDNTVHKPEDLLVVLKQQQMLQQQTLHELENQIRNAEKQNTAGKH